MQQHSCEKSKHARRVLLAVALLLVASLGAAQLEGSSSMSKMRCRVISNSVIVTQTNTEPIAQYFGLESQLSTSSKGMSWKARQNVGNSIEY
mgnify:FL=1